MAKAKESSKLVWRNECVNPLGKEKHKSNDLRRVSNYLREKFSTLPEDSKICSKCRKEIYKLKTTQDDLNSKLNSSVSNIDFSDLIASNIESSDAEIDELDDDKDVDFVSVMPQNSSLPQCDDLNHKAAVEVLEAIIEKFKISPNRSERIQLLTLAPKSLGRKKIMSMFGASERSVRIAKKLVSEQGILALPAPRKGKPLDSDVEKLVKQFYQQDDNSRLLAGMKDFVSIRKSDGSREHVQKRLVLCNLKELYSLFKSEHKEVEICFSKFAQLRPANCVLAGSSGTHTVCVCVYHENVRLMIESIGIQALINDSQVNVENYSDCINLLICSHPTSSCYLGGCEFCPGESKVEENLIKYFEENEIDEIKFDSWTQTDRCALNTIILSTDDFVNELCQKLMKLKSHHFIAKEQSSFMKSLKNSLQKDEFLITCDFAENYAFVLQNSAQSFHWNNDQATIFTVVIYYKEFEKLEHKSIVIISDNLTHDTAAVYVYQNIIIDYLKTNFHPKKLYYFTDGAGQHFKNKNNFANLLAHLADFGIVAEWHFHATAHGKGPCDGVGASIKRNAARYSLQCSSENRILTAKALFDYTKIYCKETVTFYSSKDAHLEATQNLKRRFDDAQTVPGTLQYHSFAVTEDNKLQLKKFSTALECDYFTKKTKKIPARVSQQKISNKKSNKKSKK